MIGFPIPPIFFVVPIDTGGEGEKVFLIPPTSTPGDVLH